MSFLSRYARRLATSAVDGSMSGSALLAEGRGTELFLRRLHTTAGRWAQDGTSGSGGEARDEETGGTSETETGKNSEVDSTACLTGSQSGVRVDVTKANLAKMPGLGVTHGSQLMIIMFTCKKCETRAVKRFSKGAYEHGVVIVQCPGCQNRHLIADNLGWFEDSRTNIETIMARQGDSVVRIDDSTLEWDPDAQDTHENREKKADHGGSAKG